MRHQYTPIFRDVLTSRIWAAAAPTRAVWLWFQLAADPEGFVSATTSGVAIGAHVSESEARGAIELLESVDPDHDPDDVHEGRVIHKVPRGWLVLTLVRDRERAKEESRKARNRRYMQRVRAEQRAANDPEHAPAPEDTSSHNQPEVSPPKPIPKPKPISSGGDPPKPPLAAQFVDGSFVTTPAVVHRIPPDWFLSPELVAEAKAQGVADPAGRFAELKRGPVGGQRGIFPEDLLDYIRAQFPKWRTWEETDRAKAANAKPWQREIEQPQLTPPPPPPPKVAGMPQWVRESHMTFAAMHGLDLKTEAKAFAKSHHIPPRNLRPTDAAEAFTHYLLGRVTEAA